MEEKFAHAPAKPEAPVDSVLKDIATIILSTFLLIGWVAFIITYPLVSPALPSALPHVSKLLCLSPDDSEAWANTANKHIHFFPHVKVNIY